MIAERRAKEGSLTERGPTNDGLLRIDLDGNDDAGGSLDDLPSPEPVPSLATYLDERERCLARSAACRANFSAYVNDARRSAEVGYMPIKLDIENVSPCNCSSSSALNAANDMCRPTCASFSAASSAIPISANSAPRRAFPRSGLAARCGISGRSISAGIFRRFVEAAYETT